MGDEAGLRSSQECALASWGRDQVWSRYPESDTAQRFPVACLPGKAGGRSASGSGSTVSMARHKHSCNTEELELRLWPKHSSMSPKQLLWEGEWGQPWPWPPHSTAWEPVPRVTQGKGDSLSWAVPELALSPGWGDTVRALPEPPPL